MTGRDLHKLADAGFTIIRVYEDDKTIKMLRPQKTSVVGRSNSGYSWQKFAGPFHTKKATRECADEMLKDEIVVEDL